MCWIALKEEENDMPYEYIVEAQKKNEDGYGVSWHDGTQIQTYKTLDFAEFLRFLATIEDQRCILHLRNTTAGSNCISNSHPFKVPTGVMFHNGTIYDLKPAKYSTEGKSDTSKLADLLNGCKFSSVKDIEPLLHKFVGNTLNRLVFLNNDGSIDIINRELGIEEDGNWYSNDYHLPAQTYKAFVYGTLKQNYSNHSWMTGTS